MALEEYLRPIDHNCEPRIYGANPCAECGYPIEECSWLHEGKPVEGWIAEKTTLNSNQKSTRPAVDTYHITYFPLYQPPRKRSQLCGGIKK